VFQGRSSLNLDGKGRINMPTKFRDAIAATCNGQLTVTLHPHGCLLVYPRPQWERVRERIEQLPLDAHWYRRIFLGNAADVELDGTGRVLLAPELREAAGLDKVVDLMGAGNYLEIWDSTTYKAKLESLREQAVPNTVGNLIM
jgi:MraZ protein